MFNKLVDRWTLIHFAFWTVIGANITWHSIPFWIGALIVVGGAYAWEVLEAFLERKGLVTGSENPLNRWISDPAISVIGALFGAWWVL